MCLSPIVVACLFHSAGGTLSVVSVYLETPDGNRVKISQDRMVLVFNGNEYTSMIDDDDNTYHFGNVVAPSKIGSTPLKIFCKNSS